LDRRGLLWFGPGARQKGTKLGGCVSEPDRTLGIGGGRTLVQNQGLA